LERLKTFKEIGAAVKVGVESTGNTRFASAKKYAAFCGLGARLKKTIHHELSKL